MIWAEGKVHCVDCLEAMRDIEDGCVDHIITDPPYSEHVHNKARRGGHDFADSNQWIACYSRSTDIGFEALTSSTREAVACHVSRILRRWFLSFTNAEGQGAWERDLVTAGLEHVRVGAWVKLNSTPQFTGDRPSQGFEAIEIAHPKGRKRWNGGGRPAVWSIPIVICRDHATPRYHTTQKPIALMIALVRDFTDPGDLILDPFAGSGTTGVAAIQLGRRFIGFEIDPDYCRIANERIEAARRGQDLRSYREGQTTLFDGGDSFDGR